MNGFSSWKFSLFDLAHELSRVTILVGNLFDFSIKEVLFCLLNSLFESLPAFQIFGLSVHVKIPTTIIVPPSFRMLRNIDLPGVFVPYSFDIIGKQMNDIFKSFSALNKVYFETLDRAYQLVNKMTFLITILDKKLFY